MIVIFLVSGFSSRLDVEHIPFVENSELKDILCFNWKISRELAEKVVGIIGGNMGDLEAISLVLPESSDNSDFEQLIERMYKYIHFHIINLIEQMQTLIQRGINDLKSIYNSSTPEDILVSHYAFYLLHKTGTPISISQLSQFLNNEKISIRPTLILNTLNQLCDKNLLSCGDMNSSEIYSFHKPRYATCFGNILKRKEEWELFVDEARGRLTPYQSTNRE